MEIKNLDTFIQVAEQCSFTRAAAKLGYSQSTISFQIKQLEQSLGIQLFERVNHTVTLTEKGRDVLSYAHKMQILQDELEKSLSGRTEISGYIKIAMADSMCTWVLNNDFKAFHEKYPDISIKIITASTQDMFWLLDHNEVDLVYTLDSHIYNRDYVIAREEKMDAHFVTSADDRKTEMLLESIVKYPTVMTEKGMSYRKAVDDVLASMSLELRPVLEVGDVNLICELVSEGMGISFLPDFISSSYIEKGRMKYINVEGFETDIWRQLLYHKDKWISPAMKCVIEYLSGEKNAD